MKSRNSILDRWAETLGRDASRPAILDSAGQVLRTYGDIEKEAAEWDIELARLTSGTVLAIQVGNHPAWPALFLAALRREFTTLPLEASITESERTAALKLSRAAALLVVDHDDSIQLITREGARFSPHGDPARPVLLKLTSGTTAIPRAVRFQSNQLLADCDQICETMGIRGDDLNYAVIPVSHSYGFSNVITPLLARGISMVVSRDRLPRAILDGLSRTRATVFPGMPVFYQAFCSVEATPPLDHLRLCISAGAPLPGSLGRAFREKFGQAIHSFYGSSECGGICYDRSGEADEDGFVGSAMQGVELEILDAGAPASQVRVRSAAVADGYFPHSDEGKLSHGMFIPDDLLAPHGSGFKIAGRISDLINVAGKKVNPAEIEAHLLSLPGVRQAVVFGRQSALRNEEVAACVVTDSNIAEADLLQSCRMRLSGWQVPKRIFLVPEIPVNERGKTNRRELAARFAKA
jgi:acyl-CoA synthetase (AMP-forming)/AMP-acid ligase II